MPFRSEADWDAEPEMEAGLDYCGDCYRSWERCRCPPTAAFERARRENLQRWGLLPKGEGIDVTGGRVE